MRRWREARLSSVTPGRTGGDMKKCRIGVIGCGAICEIYLTNLCERLGGVEVAAVADRHPERARKAALAHGVARALSPEELIADPGIDLVLNLTPPLAHASLSMRALGGGQARLFREASGRRPRGGGPPPRGREVEGPASGLRSRYLPGRGAPLLRASCGFGGDRRVDRSLGLYDGARARVLAPESGILL